MKKIFVVIVAAVLAASMVPMHAEQETLLKKENQNT